MDYARLDDDALETRISAGKGEVVFRAENIRRTRTGVHAKTTIGTQGIPLSSETFNVERDDYRTKLTNKFYKRLGQKFGGETVSNLNEAYPQVELELDFMVFCDGLWTECVGAQTGEWLEGDTDPKPPDYLLEPYILRGGGTIMFAPPESLKSYSMLLWLVSIDAGISRYWEVQQERVMVVNLERSRSSMAARLGLVNDILGLPIDRPLLFLNRKGRRLVDVLPAAERMVADEGVELTALDSLSRGGFGNLNENEASNEAMDYMNKLSPSWIAIGHTPRADSTHVFGSTMFEAAADVLVRVYDERDEDGDPINRDDLRGVGYTSRGNDVPNTTLRRWAFEFNDVGLRSIREAGSGEFPELAKRRDDERTQEQRVFDQMMAFGSQSQKTIREAFDWDQTRASRVWTSLVTTERIVFDHKKGNEQFYRANAPEEVSGD